MAVGESTLRFKRELVRVRLPVKGLQEEAAKLNKLLAATFAPDKFLLPVTNSKEAKDRLVEILSCLADICGEMSALMDTLTSESASPIQTRLNNLDPV